MAMRIDHETSLNFFTSLKRAQLAASFSSLIDYSCSLFFTEVCHLWYLTSVAIGGTLGGALNFYLNRRWSFQALSEAWYGQALRYLLVSVSSLGLNLLGTYFLKELLRMHYLPATIMTSLCVGLLFNFPMQKFYIYRRSSPLTPPSSDQNEDASDEVKTVIGR